MCGRSVRDSLLYCTKSQPGHRQTTVLYSTGRATGEGGETTKLFHTGVTARRGDCVSMALLTSRAGLDFVAAGAARSAFPVSATPTSPGFAAEANPRFHLPKHTFRPPARGARRVARSLAGYATQPLRPGSGAVVGFNKALRGARLEAGQHTLLGS